MLSHLAAFTQKLSAQSASNFAKLKALDLALATIDFDMDGIIISANTNFLSLVGYELAELKGQHHRMLVDPVEANSEEYRQFWDDLKKGRFHSAEYKRLGRGGKEVWIQATYNPILDRAGRPVRVVKFATDVTARKMANAKSDGQIVAINASQAVIHFEMDGTILEANDAFLTTMGYALSEVVGQHHRMFVASDVADSWDYAAFWKKLGDGQFQVGEFCRIAKDGREVWIQATYNPIFDMNGRPFRVVKYATDITKQKVEAADQRGQIEAIGRSQAVIAFNLDGVVLDANDNFCNAMGYQRHEVVGQHHQIFVESEYARSREYQEFWQRLRRGEFFSAIFERVGRNGRKVSIQATYNPILDLNGRTVKIVKYATDVTRNMQARGQAMSATGHTLSNVRSVAAASEEMSASVSEIAEAMGQSKAVVDLIHEEARQAGTSQQRLDKAAEAMDGVVQAINRIAEKINLLALNATIEAARAGEAGKGFVVVANEVKELANQATTATNQISREINQMQKVTGEVGESLLSITARVGKAQELVTRSAAAIELQRTVTRSITENMQQAASEVELIGEGLRAWA